MVDSVRGSTPRIQIPTTGTVDSTATTTPVDPTVLKPTGLTENSEYGTEVGTQPQAFANGTTGQPDTRTAAKQQTAPKPHTAAKQQTAPQAQTPPKPQAKTPAKAPETTGDKVKKVVATAGEALGRVDLGTAVGGANTLRKGADNALDLLSHTKTVTKSATLVAATSSKIVGGLQKGVSAANFVANTYNTATNAKATYQSIKEAVKNPTKGNVLNAVSATTSEAKSAIFALKGGLSTAKNVAGAVTKSLATSSGGEEIAERAAAKAIALRGAEVVGEVAGKTLGRLTPGLSVGIAVLDAAKAAHDWADPHVSRTKAVFSSITALGSALSAAGSTSLIGEPLAAVGAGIAVVSGILGSFFK
jgi:hypothetical protein